MKRLIGLFVLCVIVSACNDKPPARTVFDTQVKAIEKAKAVEGKLQQSAERRADQVEQETK